MRSFLDFWIAGFFDLLADLVMPDLGSASQLVQILDDRYYSYVA
jgi:hypothetical protein